MITINHPFSDNKTLIKVDLQTLANHIHLLKIIRKSI